jgi:hypothetical protein
VPVHSVVRTSVVAKSDEEAFALVRSQSFDARRLVVLSRGDAATEAAVVQAAQAASRRRIVQFTDSDWCYLVGEDGKRLAHIDDEATFLANRFRWSQIERLPAAEFAKYEVVPDTDLAGKRAVGLQLTFPPTAGERPPELIESTPNRVRLRVACELPAYLVVSTAYDPGWKATLSGSEVPVLRANYAFQAIEVPPGTWEIELRYLPDSLILGLWIGAASLALAITAFVISRRRARVPA